MIGSMSSVGRIGLSSALPTAVAPAFDHAIVVLGCAAEPDGRPSAALVRRLQQARREAERDPKALIIVTGGAVANSQAEGWVMKQWLVDHGVRGSRIRVEDQARFTLDNARRVAPMLARAKVSLVTVVTESFHSRRGTALVARALGQLGLGAVAVRASPAPSVLTGEAMARRQADEALKLERDLATFDRSGRPFGYRFDVERFSRRARCGQQAA